MTPEKTKRNQVNSERRERRKRTKDVRNIDVWARSAPIRLAGYEDDPTESHILRGID
ncbi:MULTISPECIES: hypothetical protein [unclassified Streptomyces]|uniref:hypothetical protein n=1 Tax=unclassified Streptomyces TaxID=2593676 RepID=UPI003FD60D7B